MSDLTEMMRMIYASQPTGMEAMEGYKSGQLMQMQDMALQEKKRQMDETEQLRKMFASGKSPSLTDIMAVNPEFGLKYNQDQAKMMQQMLDMQEKEAISTKTGCR